MGIIQLAAAAVTAAVLALLLKKEAPVFALLLAFGAGVIIIIAVMPQLKSVMSLIRDIAQESGANSYVGILFKIIGISYTAQFAADICEDAGERGLASKAVLAGKVLAAFYSLPVVTALIEQINLMFR